MEIYSPKYNQDVQILENIKTQRSYQLFRNAIQTESTFGVYDPNLTKFLKWAKIPDYDALSRYLTDDIQKLLEDYLLFHKSRKPDIRRKTIMNLFSPIELFLKVNKILYYKDALHLMFPKDNVKKGNDKPYTTDDIRKMLASTTKIRTKALILFFASIGSRPAVLTDPILKFKNVFPMPFGCKAILCYNDSNEEYWAFLTPEASKALDDYVDYRINKGEKITKESPVFVGLYKLGVKYTNENLIPLGEYGIGHMIRNVIKQGRIERIKKGSRYDKAQIYGFRKRFNTILKIDSEINSNIAEKLMAHKNGLDGVYLTPTREESFREFRKAIPELTINESEKLKIEVGDLEEDKEITVKKYEERLTVPRLIDTVLVDNSPFKPPFTLMVAPHSLIKRVESLVVETTPSPLLGIESMSKIPLLIKVPPLLTRIKPEFVI